MIPRALSKTCIRLQNWDWIGI